MYYRVFDAIWLGVVSEIARRLDNLSSLDDVGVCWWSRVELLISSS